MTDADRADLAEFLRVRRAAVDPSTVGLPVAGRRRTPGLRREEVALLAGVSVSWYTWLEQGRPINASRQVLESLARTLRLDPVETEHLLALAGLATLPAVSGPRGAQGSPLADDLHLLLDALEPAPAYVLDPVWDFLGHNASFTRLYPPIEGLGGRERNLVWAVFAEPSMRHLLDDWDAEARRVLSQFRAQTTSIRHDPAVRHLVVTLTSTSLEFAHWWPRHDVAAFESRERTFRHPVAGRLRFRHQQLHPAGHPGLTVVAHLPVPGDDSVERLRHSGHVVA